MSVLKKLLNFINTSESKMEQKDIALNAFKIMSRYIPNLNRKLFTAFINHGKENIKEKDLGKIRYVLFEDENVSEDSEGSSENEYPCHYREDEDKIKIWEKEFIGCGYELDELDEELREDTFFGLIDLDLKKYTRVNGFGKEIEFTLDLLDWADWTE
jgi:hypothetical protein